jgi:Zn-dependent M16 (insulinase) family peptidase
MVAIVRDILARGDLDDHGRLKDVLAEERNQLRASVAPSGHSFAWRTAAAGLSRSARREEQWFGASQIRFLNGQAGAFGDDGAALRGRLAELRRAVFRRGRALLNLTGDGECLAAMREALPELVEALPAGGAGDAGAAPAAATSGAPRGVAIPGEVCYVARVLPAPRHNEPEAPIVWVLSNHLRTGYLYKKIRVEGGAYGGLCIYDPMKGQLPLLSYRDPNLEKTLEAYDTVLDAFLAESFGPDELRIAIVGAVGRLDRPLDPVGKGHEAMRRKLLGLTDDDRRRFREGVLSVTIEQLRACADGLLRRASAAAPQAVLAKRERIEAANAALAKPFAVETIEEA